MKIEFIKWLSRISIILSIFLASFGIYIIIKDAEILEGFMYIFLAFTISIDHWIKLFKNKK
ncbi:MAG: hypothetical protein CMC81_02770 [Flavobacteriaceae bacterium]|nr:hypothetical protein [Flavobacteriaceae bacterium]|tara:strand:+ start:214 stop:396 length:183 start_codon:yes stop_codon:yes gene_type:complete